MTRNNIQQSSTKTSLEDNIAKTVRTLVAADHRRSLIMSTYFTALDTTEGLFTSSLRPVGWDYSVCLIPASCHTVRLI